MNCDRSISAPLSLALSLIVLALVAGACTSNDYETGDGDLSYLRADFVEVHTCAQKTIDYAITDEGDSLVFAPKAEAEWATTSDSIYRALLTYNHTTSNGTVTDVINVGQVMTLWMVPTSRLKSVYTDPVSVESMWMSTNGKYVNMSVYLKTGKKDETDVRQTIAMVCDTVMKREDGTNDYRLRLYHDQNGIPEYYSSRVYVSVPISTLRKGDVVNIEANTYDGVLARSFVK